MKTRRSRICVFAKNASLPPEVQAFSGWPDRAKQSFADGRPQAELGNESTACAKRRSIKQWFEPRLWQREIRSGEDVVFPLLGAAMMTETPAPTSKDPRSLPP